MDRFLLRSGSRRVQPTDEELKLFCNLGYASNCSRLPQERACDAVRFGIARDTGSHYFYCSCVKLAIFPQPMEHYSTIYRWDSGSSPIPIREFRKWRSAI